MEETVKQLERGTSFHKVRGINKIYPRKFKVDVENMRLMGESKKWWSPSGTSGELMDGFYILKPIGLIVLM